MTVPARSLLELLSDQRIVAVVRHRDTAAAERIAMAAVEGGVHVVEITLTVPGAADLVRQLRASLPPQVVVGAGTVLDDAGVRSVVEAGAQFVVSPVLAEPVVLAAAEAEVPVVPGILTPTEAFRAVELGCAAVKLFPASERRPAFVPALTEVLPGLAVLPTGGIGESNAAEWLAAGACAIGVGGALTAAHDRGGGAAVTELARRLVIATTGT